MAEAGKGAEKRQGGIERPPSLIGENPEERVIRGLLDAFPDAVTEFKKVRDGLVRIKLERRELFKACKLLKDQFGFEHLSMVSAVEYDSRFEIVYHICSYQNRMIVELIVQTPKDDPSVDSVSAIWGGANWQEREAFDLMGVKFNNHPKLERILLPKDYLYHPLRKDFKG
jgi:NADH:ubiquinone oxidoreductase subunit C